VEYIQSLHLFTGADELDRLSYNCLDRKCRTTAGVTVHLGEHYSVKVEPVVECLRCLYSILTGHRIHNEECFGRVEGLLERRDLVHELLVYCKTSGSIDDNYRVAFRLCLGDSMLGDLDRILYTFLRVNLYSDLLSENLQLVDRCRTEIVAGSEENLHSSLALDVKGKLSGECGLTGTVETGNEDNCRGALEIYVSCIASHEGCKFVVDDLHDHLLRLHCCKHILSDGLFLDVVTELLRDLVAHVGVQKGAADVLHRFRDVYLGNLSFTFEDLERSLQSFT